jgi:hypothetical protein
VAYQQIGHEPIWVAAMGKLIASIMTPFKCLQFNEPFVIHTSADDAKKSEDVQGSGARFPLFVRTKAALFNGFETARCRKWSWNARKRIGIGNAIAQLLHY